MEVAAQSQPHQPREHHGGPLAVLICGTFNTNLSTPQYEFKRDNPFDVNQVLGRSPLETWARLKRTPGVVHMFSCTDKPMQSASFPWSGQWTFSSESQFERIYHCLKRIEPDLTKPRHSAYLRLRPDAVVLGSLLLVRNPLLLFLLVRPLVSGLPFDCPHLLVRLVHIFGVLFIDTAGGFGAVPLSFSNFGDGCITRLRLAP